MYPINVMGNHLATRKRCNMFGELVTALCAIVLGHYVRMYTGG